MSCFLLLYMSYFLLLAIYLEPKAWELFVSCHQPFNSVCRLLLEYKADVTMRDDEGSYPLHYAASAEVAQVLLQAGADVNAVNFGRSTALHYAETWSVAEMLILHGANIRAMNSYNDTSLILAVTKGRWSSVLCQLMYGAIRTDHPNDRELFGQLCSLSARVLEAYRAGAYRHLFGHSSLLLSPPELRPSLTDDGRIRAADASSAESVLSDALRAKFERFGTTSILNQLKTNVVLVLWAKSAARCRRPLPTDGNTRHAGAVRVGRRAPPPPPTPAVPTDATRHQNDIARGVINTLVWGPLSVLCRHPLGALHHATRLPAAVLRWTVNDFVGWWPLFWTDHLNRMARHASLPARLASAPSRATQHQSEVSATTP